MKCLYLILFFIASSCFGRHQENPNLSCQGEAILYSEIFSKYHGEGVYFDFEQAQVCAKETDKPMLVVFGAWGSQKFKEYYNSVLNDTEMRKYCLDNFVLAYLYVDDKTQTKHDKNENILNLSQYKKLGHKNNALQIELLKSGSQPALAIIHSNGVLLSRLFLEDWSKDELKSSLMKYLDEKESFRSNHYSSLIGNHHQTSKYGIRASRGIHFKLIDGENNFESLPVVSYDIHVKRESKIVKSFRSSEELYSNDIISYFLDSLEFNDTISFENIIVEMNGSRFVADDKLYIHEIRN